MKNNQYWQSGLALLLIKQTNIVLKTVNQPILSPLRAKIALQKTLRLKNLKFKLKKQ